MSEYDGGGASTVICGTSDGSQDPNIAGGGGGGVPSKKGTDEVDDSSPETSGMQSSSLCPLQICCWKSFDTLSI